MDTLQKPSKLPPQKRPHFLCCLSYAKVICILLGKMELSMHFHHLKSQWLPLPITVLSLWKWWCTVGQGMTSWGLNKDVNKGVICNVHRNFFPLAKHFEIYMYFKHYIYKLYIYKCLCVRACIPTFIIHHTK